MKMKTVNKEVLYSDDRVVQISELDVQDLKKEATRNPRGRIRLCTHTGVEDTLHEMIIVHARDAYVRPHKHLNKSESFHLIEGKADVILFDEAGNIEEVIPMGDYSSGKKFFYRLSEPQFHMLLIKSDIVVFHETTNGPFRITNTVFPSWAPDRDDSQAQRKFMDQMAESTEHFLFKSQRAVRA